MPNGRLTKLLIDWRDRPQPRLHVINANFAEDGATPDAARFHYVFARAALGIPESLEEFNRLTYFTPRAQAVCRRRGAQLRARRR